MWPTDEDAGRPRGGKVRVAQKVQEAHSRGATGPPQQPGWAHPSGTRCLFLAALWEPSRPRGKPEMPPGEAWGSQTRASVLPGGREGGGA